MLQKSDPYWLSCYSTRCLQCLDAAVANKGSSVKSKLWSINSQMLIFGPCLNRTRKERWLSRSTSSNDKMYQLRIALHTCKMLNLTKLWLVCFEKAFLVLFVCEISTGWPIFRNASSKFSKSWQRWKIYDQFHTVNLQLIGENNHIILNRVL